MYISFLDGRNSMKSETQAGYKKLRNDLQKSRKGEEEKKRIASRNVDTTNQPTNYIPETFEGQ